ncbi:hypothetical protein GCM10010124_13090 [Pilimelia terevasa]|uniref:Flavin reductase like domain-containing protein n=1 Tax=Pilimelia terevasa TaxID=53372 RepID=A0A8J3BII4_9ACTN|nr:flavin reductase family protein [Pilimelia terevasa]GGK21980.1 hypothetical protein GCM10010124_13090 [Pilimelia terevasa]
MDLDPGELDGPRAYRLLTGAVVPRPIAWVSTVDAAGRPNLAPFSYFAPVCARPMTLLFCPVLGPPGRPKKDTLRNIEAVPEFVVNIAGFGQVGAVDRSAAPVPPGESEFALAGVTPAPSRRVRPPRVAEAGVAFECRLRQIVAVEAGAGPPDLRAGAPDPRIDQPDLLAGAPDPRTGQPDLRAAGAPDRYVAGGAGPAAGGPDARAPGGGWVVLGTVVAITVRDELVDPDTREVDLARLDPVARVGGAGYLRAAAAPAG